MYYITKKNQNNDLLFWNARYKNFNYSSGSPYGSLSSAKEAFSRIVATYNISSSDVEIMSYETVINYVNRINTNQ